MPFVARASRILPVSPEVAFDTLADHSSWPEWMPATFRPAGQPRGRLRPGSKVWVHILGSRLPVPAGILKVDRPREIAWGGGAAGLLLVDHRFLFEPRGDASVEVLSVETWSGAVATLLRSGILPRAERIGRDQLEGLEKGALARRKRGSS